MRTTLANAKDPSSGIARVLNISPDDTRFVSYINESIQRLLLTGELFWGTWGRFQFCLTEGCITWPRQIATIESVAVNGYSIPIRNGWFEFLEAVGLQSDASSCGDGSCNWPFGNICGGTQLYDRGNACTFADIRGDNKQIKVYADVTESPNSKILLQGYDDNKNWIRTQVNDTWIDGELVALSTTPQLSTKYFSSLVAAQKLDTNGAIRLYEYDTVNLTQRAIAIYEPTETNPSYRRSLIPGLSNSGGECETQQVTVMAKLEYIPAKVDNDWLLIGNLPALKDMCQSIKFAECQVFDDAVKYEARAVQCLRRELSHYRGHGAVNPVRLVPRNVGGPGILNIV